MSPDIFIVILVADSVADFESLSENSEESPEELKMHRAIRNYFTGYHYDFESVPEIHLEAIKFDKI